MKKTKPPTYNVVPFANRYNHISPLDLENIMEDFEDMGYLSEKGSAFREGFWAFFIKKSKK